MKYFLFVSIMWMALFGCATATCSGTTVLTSVGDSSIPWKSLAGKDFEKALYRSTLDISKNHLAGYLFIKKTSDTSLRILFNNDFGMQFFDFEFVKGNFVVHYCFPSMERKSFLKILETDFRMLLFPGDDLRKIEKEKRDEEGNEIYSVKNSSGRWLYEVSASSKKILSIISKGKIVSKTSLELGRANQSTGKISIANPFIKLKIIMIPMDK